jgi:hypothetical protein
VNMAKGKDDNSPDQQPTEDVALNAPATPSSPTASQDLALNASTQTPPAQTPPVQPISSLNLETLDAARAAVAPVTETTFTTTQSANTAASLNRPSLALGA